LGSPLVLDRLELCTGLSGSLSNDHEIIERLEVRIGRTDNIGVITGIDCCCNEGGGLSVGSSNCKKVRSFNAVS
jgi:hypothetical protein